LNAARYSRLDPVYLGDDIYSKQPVCEAVRAVGAHFLFVCKPDSHKTTYEYLVGVEVPSLSKSVKRGKKRFTYTWRWMPGVPIRDGKDALEVDWLEIVIRDSNGKITYRNSFITDLPVDADNVEDLAAAGRARWKIENETFNTLKTKGYNLEHNFGHGKNNLSAVLATLNLIAFAIHLAAELAEITLESGYRSRRRQSPLLRKSARPDRLPPFPLMAQPPRDPSLSSPAPASVLSISK